MNFLKTSQRNWMGRVLLALFGSWMVGVTYLSSTPVPPMPPGFHEIVGIDKLLHFTAYAIGAILLSLVLKERTLWSRKKVIIITVCVIAAFGFVDELHQLCTPGRSGADLPDWIADLLGAAAGANLVSFAYVRLRQNRPTAQTH